MTKREVVVSVLAVLAVALAVPVALVAIDIFRLPGVIEARDARFEGAPRLQPQPWADIDDLPGRPAIHILDLEDDLAYRRAISAYVRVEPGRVAFLGFPHLESLRAKTAYQVSRLADAAGDPKRRAQMLVLSAIFILDTHTVSAEERESVVGRASNALRAALALDPDNEDAKRNLEILLRIAGPRALPGNAPSHDQSSGPVSGQGSSGGGY